MSTKPTSTDVLAAMRMVATVQVPRHVVMVVRFRIWLATQLITIAAWIGGVQIVVESDDEVRVL